MRVCRCERGPVRRSDPNCARCGGAYPQRDSRYEDEWFKRLAEAAERAGGNAEAIVGLTIRRLGMGAEQYGDLDFLRKDVVAEAHDEAADLIAYSLLETHKRNVLGGDGQHHLFQAALYAALADCHLRLAKAEG